MAILPNSPHQPASSTQQLRRRIEIFAAHGPAYHALYGRWRLARWASGLRPPAARLSDHDFYARLDLDQPALRPIRQAVTAGDYLAADARLKDYLQTRTTPRWFFAPDELPTIAAQVPKAMKQVTLARAEDICNNIFQFRQAAPVRFTGPIDWAYTPAGNTDWNWDLNRHQFFETLGRAYADTGDARYARRFRELLLDWLARNPPGVRQPSWSSVFEVAFRINTWLWGLYFFRNAAEFDAAAGRALLEGLAQHGAMLDAHLERHAANNHLLLEAKALALLGLALPELHAAAGWRRRGLHWLEHELRAQVGADGVHAERVSHYQQAIAGELLELLAFMGENGQPASRENVATLARMVEFEQWLTKPDGRLPLFGDSGLDDSHTRFSSAAAAIWLERPDLMPERGTLNEMDYWLLGPRRLAQAHDLAPEQPEHPSRAFRAGGYVILRAGSGPQAAYLAFDAAPFGYERVPTHGHADALSFELHACGQTWLMDPGVYATWAPAEWRNYFRGTRAHNTVLVDGQDQSQLVGTRLVYHPARVALNQWLTDKHFDLADASHDGYQRLPAPITHRRQILFIKPDYWVVVDELTGSGEHTFDLLFHFTPGQAVRLDPRTDAARAGQPGGPALNLLPLAGMAPAGNRAAADLITGATEPIQGWAAPYSGEKEPAPVVRYRHVGPAPVEFCTVLYPTPAGQPVTVQAQRLPTEPRSAQVTALSVTTQHTHDLIVLDRGAPPAEKLVAGFTSSARLLIVRQDLHSGEIEWKVER